MDADPNTLTIDGRLTTIKDRLGRTIISIAYKTWTPQELADAPDRQWQINTITDYFGASAQFQYASTQVGGRWVVSQITLPGSATISYSYSNGKLSSVSLPDGSTSTFTYGFDSTANTDTVTFFDAAADGSHRSKTVYLSQSSQPYYGDISGSSVGVARMVVNSNSEVSFVSLPTATTHQYNVYEGGGRLKIVRSYYPESGKHYTGWSLNGSGALDAGTAETYSSRHASANVQEYRRRNPGTIYEADGTSRTYLYDKDGAQTKVTYSDATYETWEYGAFKQTTRYRDRLSRVTKYSYDAQGNKTEMKVGLTEGTDTTNADQYNSGYNAGYDAGYLDGEAGDPYDHSTNNSNTYYIQGYQAGYSDGYPDGVDMLYYGSSFHMTYNPPSSTVDIQTADYAVYTWDYYPQGNANQYLLKGAIDPLGNRTDYEYDSNHRLTKIKQPADVTNGTRPETIYAYDSAGRLSTVTDPENNVTTYTYDARNRIIKTTYQDTTYDRTVYGTGTDANLVVRTVDRNNVATKYEYDASGRLTKKIHAYSTMNSSGTETLITDPAIKSEETYTYLNGTNLPLTVTRAGDKTEYVYDYRHRIVETKVKPTSGSTLVSKRTYVDNKLFKTEDPYGRKTFHTYSASDARLIRSIQGAVPSVTYADFSAVLNATRGSGANPTSLITDYLYNAEGETTKTIDPKGYEHTTEYDSRGRNIRQIRASGASVAAKTETIYDLASRVTEVRSPRYFDSTDSYGYQKSRTTMTYTNRGLLKTRSEAPGAPGGATESFTYALAGRQDSHVDFCNNTWVTMYPTCCERQRVTVDPLGHGTITNTDAVGNITHQIAVSDVSTHTNLHNPTDAKTLQEVTTQYDARRRPIKRTVWLVARGTIDPANPPIAGENGISATDGLTTTWTYDDDLDDATGLDSTFSSLITGLGIGANADGSAVLITNPAGERTLTISDGLGRSLRTIQLATNNTALTQVTQGYDAVVNISGYGDVLETSSTNLLSHVTKRRTDAAGRTIQAIDAGNFTSTFEYDANGNRTKSRDPNSIGEDCTYDQLNRKLTCTDTSGDVTSTAYDLAGNVTIETDAKSKTTTHTYDARHARLTSTDRLSFATTYTYDLNGNELTMTDAQAQVTTYEYDNANRRTKTTWPDHTSGSSSGQSGYGITEVAYDALGRSLRKTDQLGDTITFLYDLAGRLTQRDYRLKANSPSGTIADSDTFTYDAASRILTATKGRYANTVTMTYDQGGRLASEGLTTGGQTYTTSVAYGTTQPTLTITYPDTNVVTKTFNSRGLLSTITRGATTMLTRSYTNAGRLSGNTYGNGATETVTYDTEGLPASIAAPWGTAAYTYDANDNRTEESITGLLSAASWNTGSTGFDFDDRLVTRNQTGNNESWTLSQVGNWNTYTLNGTGTNRTHAAAHEVATVGANSVTHDSRGNITQSETGKKYAWDFDGHMSSNDGDGNNTADVTYAYDALGRRVSRTAGGTTLVFCSLKHDTIGEYTSGSAPGSPQRTYIHGQRIDEPIAMIAGSNTYYYHADASTSIRALTGASAAIEEVYQYTSYGQPTMLSSSLASRSSSSVSNRYLFTAREWDDALTTTAAQQTGSYYFRDRWLSPTLGRFVSRDPLTYVDGPGLYRAHFVPKSIDPTGLESWDMWDSSGYDYRAPPAIRPRPPSNAGEGRGKFHGTTHKITFVVTGGDCGDIRNEIYNELKTFEHFDGGHNDVATVTLETGEDSKVFAYFEEVSWGLGGPSYLIGNADEAPVGITYLDDSHTVVGETLKGHMLEGTRSWWVTVAPTTAGDECACKIEVGTMALERKVGVVNDWGAYLIGTQEQMKIWDQYLLNISDAHGGKGIVSHGEF